MPTLSHHGGMCCGVKHIWGFPTSRAHNRTGEIIRFVAGDENVRAALEDVTSLISTITPGGRVYEVTLTDDQIEIYGQGLIDLNFTLVTYFYNENSGNNVGIFHYAPTRRETAPDGLPTVRPKNRVLRSIRAILREHGVRR